jgi:uncharacterized membrane protein YhaH (DUF805 family)
MHWFIDPIKNQYADFTGRATRQQFWMYVLVYIGVSIVVGIVAGILKMPFLGNLLSLALMVPSWAIGARRLHDIDKSGWWQLLGMIPVIGWIILIIWMATKGDKEANQYGPSLLASEVSAAVETQQETSTQVETPTEPQA